ncbi:hypothetical protein TNCT_133311 [Trichonephila clavata]|uniref:Uncharacterized protein n=1 Tax=Trichonephila clavata TaxID=2740835 RepID=A0A8X6LCY1_TRICU|nr:hypothetical protein TNCT_133311 [Trichonephila clavata]
MTPGMDPQSELWNYAISALVQRSSGDQHLGSDLYQEFRLKAKNSFRSRDGISKGEFFTQQVKDYRCYENILGWGKRNLLYFSKMAVVIVISLSIKKAILARFIADISP